MMLELRQARGIKGTVTLPPCPDLYFLSACIAVATGAEAHIGPVDDTPLTADFERRLAAQADIKRQNDRRMVRPKSDNGSSTVELPYPELPHADLVAFMLLGAGKTLMFESIPQTKVDAWRRVLRTAGCDLELSGSADRTALYLSTESAFTIPDVPVPPNALHPYLGLAIGQGRPISFTTDYPFVSPLRHVLPAFGFEPEVRSSAAGREADPLAKRLRFLGVKRREQAGQSFTTTVDFAARPQGPAEIDLPGDRMLAATLMLAKSVVQRGSLVIENVPLESWSTAMLNHLRKMGCRAGTQESRRSSYGAAGMVQLQAFTVQGRKAECVPLFQYVDQLPAMVVLSCFAKGQSVFRALDPLHDERPDPIERMLHCVRTMGGRHGEMPDGMVIDGAQTYDGFDVTEELPASMAAACAAGALRCAGKSTVAAASLHRRWPSFGELLDAVCEYRT